MGATRAAAVLPAFLTDQLVAIETLGAPACARLVESGHAISSDGGIRMSDTLGVTARAWRRVLSGESEDLSSCEATLDGWCAELLAALSGAPERASEVRRELRRFGVAAFGLLADAA
ncbi:MAG: hypothetical protein IPI67_00835 [Myxococcales bacterium]|nr:hypothetical protein [Myxococcales bacterium]